MIIVQGSEASRRISVGLSVAQRLAASTIGPYGGSVIAARGYGVPIMQDAVSTIRAVMLEDRIANLGVSFAREVAVQTSDEAGDGTATAVLLFEALVRNGIRQRTGGLDGACLSDGIRLLGQRVETELMSRAVPISQSDNLLDLAARACGGDEGLGQLTIDALASAGVGRIVARTGTTSETTMSVIDGLQMEATVVHDILTVGPSAQEATIHAPIVHLFDGIISEFDPLVPWLEKASEGPTLVIIARDIVGEALEGLVKNRRQGVADIIALKSSRRGADISDLLDDVGAALDTPVYGPDRHDNLHADHDARPCDTVEVYVGTKEVSFTWKGPPKDSLVAHRCWLEKAKHDRGEDTGSMNERLARLTGRSVLISVGGHTIVEAKERRDRLAVGLRAAKSAVLTGVVEGGGAALVHVAEMIATSSDLQTSERAALPTFRAALAAPFNAICHSANVSGPFAAEALRSLGGRSVFDLHSGKSVPAVEARLLDPNHVVNTATKVAVSVAASLLNSDVMLVQSNQ